MEYITKKNLKCVVKLPNILISSSAVMDGTNEV